MSHDKYSKYASRDKDPEIPEVKDKYPKINELSVMTWNVLAVGTEGGFLDKDGTAKKIKAWGDRRKDIVDVIRSENPDIVCLQELCDPVTNHQSLLS